MKKINWNPTPRDLFVFGWIFIGGFGLAGLALFFRGHQAMAWKIWVSAGTIGALAIVVPAWAKPFYWAWMGLGFVVGAVMSRVVMTVIFYAVLTPLSLVFRIMKRDPLKIRQIKSESYWVSLPTQRSESDHEHLF
jgi:hypothetical protein